MEERERSLETKEEINPILFLGFQVYGFFLPDLAFRLKAAQGLRPTSQGLSGFALKSPGSWKPWTPSRNRLSAADITLGSSARAWRRCQRRPGLFFYTFIYHRIEELSYGEAMVNEGRPRGPRASLWLAVSAWEAPGQPLFLSLSSRRWRPEARPRALGREKIK